MSDRRSVTQYRGADSLPDPFCDVASLSMPTTMVDGFRWEERVFERMGVYRSALERIIAYFLTDIQIAGHGVGRAEKKKYEDYMFDTLGIRNLLFEVALDYQFYGNSLTSAMVPIRRYLACPRCAMERTFAEVQREPVYEFVWRELKFHALCPRCQFRGAWREIDRRAADGAKLMIKRWAPQEIEIAYEPVSEHRDYIWKLDPQLRTQVRNGDPQVLEYCRREVLDAVRCDGYLKFEKDFIYHMRQPHLAGQKLGGWALSRVLTNFGAAYNTQILHRYNLAIALDFVLPFRVITPAAGAGPVNQAPEFKVGYNAFQGRVDAMVRARRQDPTKWFAFPYPLQYQTLGGDAQQFTTRDLLDQAYDTLFASIGCPIEFYRGSLTQQNAVPALRIFEAHHQPFRSALCGFVQFVADAVAARFEWAPVVVTLPAPRHADDITRQQMQLQMGLNKEISKTTALRALDLEFEDETRRKLEEDQLVAELTAEKQEEMDQQVAASQLVPPGGALGMLQQQQAAQQGAPGAPAGAPGGGPTAGMPAASGAPGSPNMGTPANLEEAVATAQAVAREMASLDETTRKQRLAQYRRENPALADLVVKELARYRSQVRMEAGNQALAAGGGGGGM